MTDRIKDLENKAGGYEADRLPYVQVMATLELARQQRETNVQLTRIADALDRRREPAQANGSPFSNVEGYGDYEPSPVEQLGISGGTGFDSVPTSFRDPMKPDYEQLAADEPTSQIQDSRDSAEVPNIQ
jgi:hypothetical protein